MNKGEQYTKQSLAKHTIKVEQKELKENVGVQDQIQVCHGGFNVTRISKDSSYSLLSLDKTNKVVERIDDSLILVYSGITRFSSKVQKNRKNNSSDETRNALATINKSAESFAHSLINYDANYASFCELLTRSWEAKLSTMKYDDEYTEIVEIYEKAIRAGAKTGKLLGAGGGGFFAFFVDQKDQDNFMRQMKPYICVNANISFDGVSRIL